MVQPPKSLYTLDAPVREFREVKVREPHAVLQPRRRLLTPGPLVLALSLLVFEVLHAQQSSDLFGGLSARTGLLLRDDVTVALIQNSSGDLARETVARLAMWDRSQVTGGYARAAEWIAERAKEIGLQQVTIERFPSDGKIEYFGSGTEAFWKATKAELWITAPLTMRVTSYAEMPMSLARNSTTADVETELVDVGEGTADRDYVADVKGKIVLASGVPSTVFARAVMQKGAAGVVTSWSVPPFDLQNRLPGDYPGQVGWGGVPSTGTAAGHFAFLVSARRAQELKNLLRQGSVRLHAIVEAELQPGSLDVVSGVIPGAKYPDEEIVITAHLDHYKPGANDNASGSAAILEMARTLRQLIDSRRLPPPARAIRFIWVPEYNGTRAWFSRHLADPVKRIAEMNFDMVGENAKTTNAVCSVSYSPDSNASFLNAVVESLVDFINRYNDDRYPRRPDLQVASLTGSRDRAQIRMAPYMTGTDHELFNSAGIPGTTLGAFPDDSYHSSADSIEQVDATQLHRAVVFGLLGATTLAFADDAQAPDVAWLSVVYGRQRLAASEGSATGSLLAASRDDFAALDARAKAIIPHVYRRERAAVSSAAVFARTPDTRRRIEQLAALLADGEAAAQKRVEQVAALRAADLHAIRAARVLSDADKRAARLVPAWQTAKQLTSINAVLMKLASDPSIQVPKIQAAFAEAMTGMRAQGDSELRLFGLANAPTGYVDGSRSVLEIADAMAIEYAPISSDVLELYFRAFEKAGAMRIVEK
jgi:hypothetical protein